MSTDRTALFKFGGSAFVISGVLFFIGYGLDLMAGPPPPTGAEILAWVEANRLLLSLVSEVLFFASTLLIPALIALYLSLVNDSQILATTGCGLLAIVVPVLSVLLIVQGRLVYPVYGLYISDPAVAEFAVAFFYGGLHMVGLLMAIATFLLSWAMRRGGFGMPVVALGFVTAVGDVVWSYPYLISPVIQLGCQLLLAAWFVAVGWQLFRMYRQSSEQPGAD
ncbi:MAG: hypothetical protein F6J95_025855 [Leptolyngbya sp. SIO1E4]|nr:hypothetical protein [Leptolyngbya sp. SIO1E4]